MRQARLGLIRQVRWPAILVIVLLVIAAAGESSGAVVGGQLAGGAYDASRLVGLLALLLIVSAVLDTVATAVASGAIARVERALRATMVRATFRQTLSRLQEQAVGEMLDRVDDDVAQVGLLLRTTGVSLSRAGLRTAMAWVVAGLTTPWAWIAFPLVAAAAILIARPAGRRVFERQVAEEVAWSAHAAQMEEAVAGRDDVRTALGQPFVLRNYAIRASALLRRAGATSAASSAVTLRTLMVLNIMLAALVMIGVAMAGGPSLPVAALVTLWLLACSFVGQLAQVTQHLPDIQAGLGAWARIRGLLDAPQEKAGGRPVPAGPASVRFSALNFAFDSEDGPRFVLQDIDLIIPAGTTCALVGRTGSGKSTLASFVSRAIEPPEGTTFVAEQDVCQTGLEALRRSIGVVSQRTELLDGTLLENITLFADLSRETVESALATLGLTGWAASLPDGLDTVLGPGGVTLSAGEQQLVAFARMLVREVRVVVLDEATAQMDPETERTVSRACDRLLAGRTGLVIAHRLATTERCDMIAVLEAGRIVQCAPRNEIATTAGPFRDLAQASGHQAAPIGESAPLTRTTRRREPRQLGVQRPRLTPTVLRLLGAHRRWGLLAGLFFAASSLVGVYGAACAWLWGQVVTGLNAGAKPWLVAAALAACLLASPLCQASAMRIYIKWWVACTLRLRLAILHGQTMQHRIASVPTGELMARALDSDRLVRYADRWIFVGVALVSVSATVFLGADIVVFVLAGGVLLLITVVAAGGAPLAGRAAREAGNRRAEFGRALASALGAARTVKLASATEPVQRYLEVVDGLRMKAHVRESLVRAVLSGVPSVLLQGGVVTAWALYASGRWNVATALLVATAINGFAWFGTVMAAVVTEAPIARQWLLAAAQLAGTDDLVRPAQAVDLVTGHAPQPDQASRVPLHELTLRGLTAIHEDGTVGAEEIDLTVARGAVILLVGRVGAGKSSLLRSLAGLVDYEGSLLWNGQQVLNPQDFLRPGQVSYVNQRPHVLSGSFLDNVVLDHDRDAEPALRTARLEYDLAAGGGDGAFVGHRGVRLSGGQLQRLALARALATDAELILADDVSAALDARTEIELWDALRTLGVTVIGTTSKRSALQQADLVVVLEDGRVAATGTWEQLADRWGGLAG